MPAEPRKARTKPLTPVEEVEALLGALGAVLGAFPGATPSGTLPYGELAVRCAGMVMTQNGRIACGNVSDPKSGSMCQDPRGCRREGRVSGYASP